jgi:hypothetical protein
MRPDGQVVSKAALRKRRASDLMDRLAFPGDFTGIRSFPVAAALAGSIFLTDTLSFLQFAVASLYVIVVLIAAHDLHRRGVVNHGDHLRSPYSPQPCACARTCGGWSRPAAVCGEPGAILIASRSERSTGWSAGIRRRSWVKWIGEPGQLCPDPFFCAASRPEFRTNVLRLVSMDIAAKLLGVGREGGLPFGAIEHAHNCTIRAVIGQLSSERTHRNAGGGL